MLKLSIEEMIVAANPLPAPDRHVMVEAFAANITTLEQHFAPQDITLELYSEAKQVVASRAEDFFASGRNTCRVLVCYKNKYIGQTKQTSLLPKHAQTMEQYVRLQFGFLFSSIEKIVAGYFLRERFVNTIERYMTEEEVRSVTDWVRCFNRDISGFLNGGIELRFYSNARNNARCELSALAHQSVWVVLYVNGRRFEDVSFDNRITSFQDIIALRALLWHNRDQLLKRFDHYMVCT